MGKGKGKGRGAFYDFIDNSYFAFWFRQWAAFFIVIGILLIVAGAVVFSVLPPSKAKSYAQEQSVVSETDPQFDTWKAQTRDLLYEFNSVDRKTGACSLVGPFYYSESLNKADVKFVGVTVSYAVSPTRTFSSSLSATPTPVQAPNPSYIDAVAKTGKDEQSFLLDAYSASDIANKVRDVFTKVVPDLIAARDLSQNFTQEIDYYRRSIIHPSFFSNIKKAVDLYEHAVLVKRSPEYRCSVSNCLGKDGGISFYLKNQYFDTSCGKIGASLETFKTDFAQNFASMSSSPCYANLTKFNVTSTLWNTPANEEKLDDMLEATNTLDLFISTKEKNKGYCVNLPSGQTQFGVSSAQMTDFCRFLNSFFDALIVEVPRAEVGLRTFCLKKLTSIDPDLVQLDLRADVENDSKSKKDLSLNSGITFDQATCQTFLDAVTDTSGFVQPAMDSNSIPAKYSSLTPAQFNLLRTYVLSFENTLKSEYASRWTSSNDADFGCPSTTCHVRPLSQFVSTNLTMAEVRPLLFPEFSSSSSELTPFALVTDSKPTINQGNLFSNITAASGILGHALKLGKSRIVRLLSITDKQAEEIQEYASKMIAASFKPSSILYSDTREDVGLRQFANGHLACGLKRATEFCWVAQEFMGQTDAPFYHELAFASYVTTPQPTYYKSFTQADQNLRDTATPQLASDILGFLVDVKANPLLLNAATNEQQKYLYFILSTEILTSAFSATSSALAARLPIDWINDFTDNDLPTPATFGYDNPVPYKAELNTGLSSIGSAYTLIKVDNSDKFNTFDGSNPSLAEMYITDGFPPGAISSGKKKYEVFDFDLRRPFEFTFGGSKEDIRGIQSVRGEVDAASWGKNGKYGITIDKLMPSLKDPQLFYSPCEDIVPALTCPFTPYSEKNEAGFSTRHSIALDPATGIVGQVETCVIMSYNVSGLFPFSAPGLKQGPFAAIRKQTVRTISDEAARNFAEEINKVNNTAQAVLLALVIVGGLFVITGIVFVVFWFIRRNRKLGKASEMDLVADPFGEGNKDVAHLKY